jgi:hypothetical protein
MAYKIYTYTDPYSLNKTIFWDEIKCLPHFCISRTLVNGFIDVMQDSIEGLICQLDDFVNSEQVYRNWTDNISLRIKQYGYLTATFKELLSKRIIDDSFFSSLQQNQNYFLDAIRLFIELNISASGLHPHMANREQRLLIEILAQIQSSGNELFAFPRTPDLFKIKMIIDSLAEKELVDFNNRSKTRASEYLNAKCAWLDRSIKNTKNTKLKSIVIHGVHQFSPAQLRLIIDLEKMGLEIIFLFNYQQKFQEIYSSWDYIYRYFNTPMQHDTIVTEYKPNSLQNKSNALGTALSELCEGRFRKNDPTFHSQYELYKNCELREFGNVTEYATFISNQFDKALNKFYEGQSIMDRANKVFDTSAVLRLLDEQVYTANRDVHSLLKIYYPQFSKDRHFLSYPIGQFFSAIYRLWNWETGEIDFELSAIKECLSSGILSSSTAEQLLRTAYHTDIILDGITSYTEFCEKVGDKYTKLYDEVVTSKVDERAFSLRQLSIYNQYKIKKADIQSLISAINELNTIAVFLFSNGTSREDYINFGTHFGNLEEFIKKRQPELANEEERVLISALLQRFEQIKNTTSNFSGTFNDLRNGLYYYLKQKNDESQVDWIVKNFEQIDGDILQSKGQFERGEKKVYHFACVSDKDISCPINELLPWPLTDTFILKAYSPIDLQFQVYYAALGERSNFLRYALFYGLYFNRCDVRLSYVKQNGDETTEPYVLLKILGIQPVAIPEDIVTETPDMLITLKASDVSGIKYDRLQMTSMFLCPYRYFLEYIMNNDPVIEGVFLYQKLFENILVENTWKRIQGKQKQSTTQHLEDIIKQESNQISKYFWFWKYTEIDDLKRRAVNYILNKILNYDNGSVVRNYDPLHSSMRKYFGKARFDIDISEFEPKNSFPAFEQLATLDYPNKSYQLHKLPKQEADGTGHVLILNTLDYLMDKARKDNAPTASEWCIYCPSRGICLESYLQGL